MTRPIKFRAWDTTLPSPRMIKWEELATFKCDVVFMALEEVRLMQFTGLTDKNRKEIFEGDIVKYFHLGYTNPQLGEIRFLNSSFIIVTNKWRPPEMLTKQRELLLLEPGFTIEIIGNIYENPELLK